VVLIKSDPHDLTGPACTHMSRSSKRQWSLQDYIVPAKKKKHCEDAEVRKCGTSGSGPTDRRSSVEERPFPWYVQ